MCLVIQSDVFVMVKWPFQGVKWPPTRDEKGTLNHLVFIHIFLFPLGCYLPTSRLEATDPAGSQPGHEPKKPKIAMFEYDFVLDFSKKQVFYGDVF